MLTLSSSSNVTRRKSIYYFITSGCLTFQLTCNVPVPLQNAKFTPLHVSWAIAQFSSLYTTWPWNELIKVFQITVVTEHHALSYILSVIIHSPELSPAQTLKNELSCPMSITVTLYRCICYWSMRSTSSSMGRNLIYYYRLMHIFGLPQLCGTCLDTFSW